MTDVGIDQIHFYTSDYYLDLTEFAEVHQQSSGKFVDGIGQERMSVSPPDEDIVTLGANSAVPLLDKMTAEDKDAITHLLFASESGIDQSKSAGIYIHALLGLPSHCKTVELKQACYSGTAALQFAVNIIKNNPTEKVLVVASDIARYDLGSAAEATQGCGAVSMIISANPRLLKLEEGSGVYTADIMDFWRPNYRTEAIVDGKYSAKVYLKALLHSWTHFQKVTHRVFQEISHICYHLPFSKMANKAEKHINKHNACDVDDQQIDTRVSPSQFYNRLIGNSYTASLYIAFASLLDQAKEDLSNQRVGFFSYGSGCVSEFFTGVVMNGYKETLKTSHHIRRLKNRIRINYQEYLAFYHYRLPEDGSSVDTPKHSKGHFRLSGIKAHQRQYEIVQSD